MKLYIAGPMATKPGWNRAAFDYAPEILETEDGTIEVVNPALLDDMDLEGDRDPKNGLTAKERAGFMRRDLKLLLECDGIVMLQDWQISIGANVELAVAQGSGLDVYRFDTAWNLVPVPALQPDFGLVATHVNGVIRGKGVI